VDSRALIAIALAACAGPRPEIDASTVAVAPDRPGVQRVTIDLANRSGGHGEVELQITLRGASGGCIRASQQVELDAHEQLRIYVDVPAPPESYTVDVRSEYPD
jgi:hypothetical protein